MLHLLRLLVTRVDGKFRGSWPPDCERQQHEADIDHPALPEQRTEVDRGVDEGTREQKSRDRHVPEERVEQSAAAELLPRQQERTA